MATFGRLLTAMITPFDEEGNIDFPQARKLAKGLTQSGTDGLVIGGTTGESPSMSDEEKIQLFENIINFNLADKFQIVGRRLVISGMHIHVGIPDNELRIDLMNQISYFLPHLLALSTLSLIHI